MNNNKQQPKPENPNNQFSNTEPLTHAQRVAIANTMSNNKQSSVEWLISQLQKSKDWHRVLNEISQMSSARVDIIQQAKAMHKEEHAKTWDDAMESMKARGGNDMRAWADFDDYYEQTFGE